MRAATWFRRPSPDRGPKPEELTAPIKPQTLSKTSRDYITEWNRLRTLPKNGASDERRNK